MHQYTVKNPHCGCPWQDPKRDCLQCFNPATLQTRIIYPPTKCVKRPCGYRIPAVPCNDEETKRHPLIRYSYDLTVDEPGTNDSYGLNGLNWWDWRMEEHNKKMFKPVQQNLSIPDHPYLYKDLIPPGFPDLHCRLPIECYSRTPEFVPDTPFQQPVNYTRNWRCTNALPASPWKPPTVTWATNQHL